MGLNAKKVQSNGGNNANKQEPIEAGTYPARVVQVLDLGVQEQRPYKGQAKPPVQEIMVTYELLDEFCLDEDGEPMEDKPRWLGESFPLHNLEVDLAKSTKRYKGIDPNLDHDGDWTELVGSPCMVTITCNPSKQDPSKVYNNVSSVSSMRVKQAKSAPDLVNPTKVFSLDEPDMQVFGSLPEWVQDKIKSNLEFEGSVLARAIENGEDEEEEDTPPKKAPKKKAKKAKPEPEEDDEDDGEDQEDDRW